MNVMKKALFKKHVSFIKKKNDVSFINALKDQR